MHLLPLLNPSQGGGGSPCTQTAQARSDDALRQQCHRRSHRGAQGTGDPPAGLRPARAGHKSLANRWVPPGCAAGESGGGGSSVPPRNARKTLPQLEFSKAIGSNTAAYSLNTRYFCKPCSASALSPSPSALSDGRALRLRTAPVPLGAEQELPGQPGTGHCPGSRGGPAGSARPGTAP